MILITGVSGLLGSNLAFHARARGEEVVAVYNRHKYVAEHVKSYQADLTCKSLVSDLMRRWRPDWVIHCAASTDVDWCEEHPEDAFQVNCEMSRNIARSANRVGARLVYISTDAVFDGKAGGYAEGDVPSPVNVYASSKLEGEMAVRHELDSSLIVRTNIYGWNLREKRSLAEWLLSNLESNQAVPGFEDVIFTPILVNDLSEGILDMMERRLSGVYHFAGSQACSKYEFALQLADIFGLDRELIKPISITASRLSAPRPRNTSLRTNKVALALGRPVPDVRSGLQRFKDLRESNYVRNLKRLGGDHLDVKD